MPAIEASTSQTVVWETGMERVRLMFKRLEALNSEKQQHPLYGMMQLLTSKRLCCITQRTISTSLA
jgi:hypothetical protein